LLPLVMPGTGLQVDYAAHAGGALAGAAMAGVSRFVWPQIWVPVEFRQVAAGLVVACLLATGYGAMQLALRHDEYRFVSQLIPPADLPATEAAFQEQSADLALRFPNDPRARFHRAIVLMRTGDPPGAEREAALAVALVERYPRSFNAEFRDWTRLMLAGTYQEQRRMPEARAAAKPLCGSTTVQRISDILARYKLCE